MKREDIKAMLPILQAFADGKVIQMLDNRSIWTDLTEGEGLPIGTLREEKFKGIVMIEDCQLCRLNDICKYIYAECCPYMKTEE